VPSAAVIASPPSTLPPPDTTANVTATFATGVPAASRTRTAGAVPTFVSMAAV
jgi:hypothetical protein